LAIKNIIQRNLAALPRLLMVETLEAFAHCGRQLDAVKPSGLCERMHACREDTLMFAITLPKTHFKGPYNHVNISIY
jgi:hypothetical protein